MRFKFFLWLLFAFSLFCSRFPEKKVLYCDLNSFPNFSQDICIDIDKNGLCAWGDILLKKDKSYTRFYENNRKERGQWQVNESKVLLFSESPCSGFSACNSCGAKSQLFYEIELKEENLIFKNKDQEEVGVSCLQSW